MLGANIVTTPDDDGWTPLHWTCRCLSPLNTEWLIQQGAPVAVRTVEGWIPEESNLVTSRITASLSHQLIRFFCNLDITRSFCRYQSVKRVAALVA